MSPTSGGHTPHQAFAPLAARQMIGHLHYFIKDTALAVLGDCGYEIIDWNYTHARRACRTARYEPGS